MEEFFPHTYHQDLTFDSPTPARKTTTMEGRRGREREKRKGNERKKEKKGRKEEPISRLLRITKSFLFQ